MERQAKWILWSVGLFSLAVTAVDAVYNPPYWWKIAVKFLCFTLLPLAYLAENRDDAKAFRRLFSPNKRALGLSLALGLGVYAVILGGFLLTRGIFDFTGITGGLTEKHGITGENFLLVSLYISFLNSLLEEAFFRGFGYGMLRRQIGEALAFFASAALFTLYHAGMLWGMVEGGLLSLLLLGLFAGGCLFNLLARESLYPAWCTHMWANFAINTVGFLLFQGL